MQQNQVGLYVQRRSNNFIPSSIRVLNGLFSNNESHITVDTAGAVYPNGIGDINLFGCTIGHQRATKPINASDGIAVFWPTTKLSIFGCNFEDLSHGIHVYSGNPSAPANLDALTVIGCGFSDIHDAAITAFVNANIKALAAAGNLFYSSPSGKPFLATNSGTEGVLVGGNNSSPLPTMYPATGYLEVNNTIPNKIMYRVSSFSNTTRPSPTSVLPGTMIYNTSTNHLNVMEGGVWIEV